MATAFTRANLAASKQNVVNHDPTKKPGRGVLHMRKCRVDFDAIATTTGTALAANDTFQVFDVAPGDVIIAAGGNVITATTGACVIDLGFTGGDVDMLMDGLVANDTSLPACTRGILHPVYIATSDTVDALTLTASGAGGVVEFWMLVYRP